MIVHIRPNNQKKFSGTSVFTLYSSFFIKFNLMLTDIVISLNHTNKKIFNSELFYSISNKKRRNATKPGLQRFNQVLM